MSTKKTAASPVEFDTESDELDVAEQLERGSVAAVTQGTDWTTETLVSQLRRGNIQLNPKFQRRDAWKRDRKSRFIESLIVGLPIPQIVLAESRKDRGKFIVLDGKQRLLTILQFWGAGDGASNGYALSGLTLRDDLNRTTFAELSTEASLEADYNALCNQTIRTVIIRSWKDSDFLHTVFLRLNTGSVSLSPQELRQALIPGRFADFIDEASAESAGLRTLLGLSAPDSRMRDAEILARHLAFKFFAAVYPGRMKAFLDDSFVRFNGDWKHLKPEVEAAVRQFDLGVLELVRVFGDSVARKPSSTQFNRAIFDALIFFHSDEKLRASLSKKDEKLRDAYARLFASETPFQKAIESDTAGAPNTATRLNAWAAELSAIVGRAVVPPKIPVSKPKSTSGKQLKKKTPKRR
jgi:hypothetical protein